MLGMKLCFEFDFVNREQAVLVLLHSPVALAVEAAEGLIYRVQVRKEVHPKKKKLCFGMSSAQNVTDISCFNRILVLNLRFRN